MYRNTQTNCIRGMRTRIYMCTFMYRTSANSLAHISRPLPLEQDLILELTWKIRHMNFFTVCQRLLGLGNSQRIMLSVFQEARGRGFFHDTTSPLLAYFTSLHKFSCAASLVDIGLSCPPPHAVIEAQQITQTESSVAKPKKFHAAVAASFASISHG